MTPRRWHVIGLAASLVVAVATVALTYPASAANPASVADPVIPEGGGWANAGAVPGGTGDATTNPHVAQAIGGGASPAGYSVTGIDVSHWDDDRGAIDWNGVRAAGDQFVYIKATELTTKGPYTNPYFPGDYQRAREAGMYVGAYMFARPDLDAITQADLFLNNSLWTGDNRNLIPMVDFEAPYSGIGKPRCWVDNPPSDAWRVTNWLKTVLDRIESRIGRKPMIYTSPNYWNDCTWWNTSFGDYPLDLAHWTLGTPTLPVGWNNFTFWQYHGGNSTGYRFDSQVFNGNMAALATYAGTKSSPTVSLRARNNGKFVAAESAGASALIARSGPIGAWERYDLVDLGSGYVGLRSHANGKYVTAEAAGASPLIANRMAGGDWEKFTFVDNPDGTVSLRAKANGKYVTAESNGSAPLIARATVIDSWEKFDKVRPPTTVSLKARANGKYVTAESGGSAPLIARATVVDTWERYDKVELSGGMIALLSRANSRYVTAEWAGTSPLIARGTSIGDWELFKPVKNDDGTVSLIAVVNGRYVTAPNGGATTLIASGTTIGPAEQYDMG